jgi:hypothetical protein
MADLVVAPYTPRSVSSVGFPFGPGQGWVGLALFDRLHPTTHHLNAAGDPTGALDVCR